MRLTNFLTELGRPVAYYPSLGRALGGVKQAILLCQLLYWSDKGQDPDGWIYKSVDELEQETGLSYEEQRGARAALTKAGVLEEHHRRLEHRLYFRVNKDVLNRVWDDFVTGKNRKPLPTKLTRRKPAPGAGKSPFPELGNHQSVELGKA